mmetsp:Transcript_48261/g.134756  ORF Transcript_48261/g.134756 Transcript_48261/m.134756 type:complete len:246 (-) Transcript_48261:15-752(-)
MPATDCSAIGPTVGTTPAAAPLMSSTGGKGPESSNWSHSSSCSTTKTGAMGDGSSGRSGRGRAPSRQLGEVTASSGGWRSSDMHSVGCNGFPLGHADLTFGRQNIRGCGSVRAHLEGDSDRSAAKQSCCGLPIGTKSSLLQVTRGAEMVNGGLVGRCLLQVTRGLVMTIGASAPMLRSLQELCGLGGRSLALELDAPPELWLCPSSEPASAAPAMQIVAATSTLLLAPGLGGGARAMASTRQARS